MDLEKKAQIEARLRDLMKEHNTETTKPEKATIVKQTVGNVIRRRKGQPVKRIV